MLRTCLAMSTAGILLLGCAKAPETAPPARALGAPSMLGNGALSSYAEFDAAGAPTAIGVAIPATTLDSLPSAPSDGRHCFDLNKDGNIDLATECAGWHERVLPLPSEASRRADMPFKWALLNWNPHGHIPPGIYDAPHFDVHFYIVPIEDVFAIASGPCGPEHVRCDLFAQARKPLPAGYMHPDFQDVEAVAPAMGNHLVDPSASEFHGTPFTHTWIYGTYDGHVTFYEEMVTVKFLRTQPSECTPIKAAKAVALSGYYPTQSCIRFDKPKAEYTVSLEGFKLREASAPGG
jgi:hypothetical protein